MDVGMEVKLDGDWWGWV